MEVEKPFRCCECESKFASIDNLHTHQRRHDMSLNLSRNMATSISCLSANKGSISAGIIDFTDETPTPTRFIRNCEEVGLFQDLQHVNPFDEDFKKAANSAGATPSAEEGFEFTFSSTVGLPITPCHGLKSTKSKRRYSDQDTLNTPQVFPYIGSTGSCPTKTTNTTSMSACLTPTPQNTALHQEALKIVIQSDTPTTASTAYNHEEHVSIIAYTSAISTQANSSNKSEMGNTIKSTSASISSKASSPNSSGENAVASDSSTSRISLLKIRSKSNLKLDLKTVKSRQNKLFVVAENSPRIVQQQIIDETDVLPPANESKKELLERNRAAAHRSRERRKQWVYGLESRCRALETLLAQSQAEVIRLKVENESLRRHQIHNQSHETVESTLANTVEPCKDNNISFMDTTGHNTIVIHEVTATGVNEVIREPLAENGEISTGMMATIVSPIVLPTVKSKRGRPRKGEERRVPILAVPITSSTEKVATASKIPILPITLLGKGL